MNGRLLVAVHLNEAVMTNPSLVPVTDIHC